MASRCFRLRSGQPVAAAERTKEARQIVVVWLLHDSRCCCFGAVVAVVAARPCTSTAMACEGWQEALVAEKMAQLMSLLLLLSWKRQLQLLMLLLMTPAG